MDSIHPVDSAFRARAVFVIHRVAITLLLLFIASQTLPVLLLLFAGLLVAILLNTPSALLHRRTGIGYPYCFAAVVLAIIALVTLPEAFTALRERLDGSTWGQAVLRRAGNLHLDALPEPPAIARGVGMAFSAISGVLAGFVVMLFLGLYGAATPGIYRRGVLLLAGPRHADALAGYLDEAMGALRSWLGGTFASMAVIGVGTWLGLWWLYVPLAPILGLIAAMLTFIPNLGPIIAAVPAVLIGLADSPRTALSVAILYVSIQFVESYLITPLIQRRAVKMPPALALGSQLLLGSFVGIVGLALATPLAAVGIAVVRRMRGKT